MWKSENVGNEADPRTLAPFSGQKLNAGSPDDCGRYGLTMPAGIETERSAQIARGVGFGVLGKPATLPACPLVILRPSTNLHSVATLGLHGGATYAIRQIYIRCHSAILNCWWRLVIASPAGTLGFRVISKEMGALPFPGGLAVITTCGTRSFGRCQTERNGGYLG